MHDDDVASSDDLLLEASLVFRVPKTEYTAELEMRIMEALAITMNKVLPEEFWGLVSIQVKLFEPLADKS